MKIFYIDIEKFKKTHSDDFLKSYCDIKTNNEKRFLEYSTGRFLVKSIAKEFYNISDPKIILNGNGKPEFKDADLHFNISHSKNIVIACFDNAHCAIDIEFIKNRDLNKLSKFFKKDFKTQKDFYKFWTYKEAEYKLGKKIQHYYCQEFLCDYYLTVASENNISKSSVLYPVEYQC